MGLLKKFFGMFFGNTKSSKNTEYNEIMYNMENVKWDELNIQYEYALEMKKEESLIKIAETFKRKNQHFLKHYT